MCEEADKALKSMVQSITPLSLLHKLQACVNHTNPRVRAKAAVSISNCVSRMVDTFLLSLTCYVTLAEIITFYIIMGMLTIDVLQSQGLEELEEFGLVPLVQVAANLLNDRLPEAREAARSITMSVYESFTEKEDQKQESWQNFCEANLPALHGQSIIKLTMSH